MKSRQRRAVFAQTQTPEAWSTVENLMQMTQVPVWCLRDKIIFQQNNFFTV